MTEALRRIAESRRFQFTVLGIILVAAVLVALETDEGLSAKYGKWMELANRIILGAFIVEALIKMGQHGWHFYRYFKDPWNLFDFAVIVACLLPIDASYAAVLRLARVFRSLRLVTAIPKLQMLVNALINSIPSMIYVGILLFLLFFVYGVMGVFLFRDNDPVHFLNLPTSMLSLFRVVTQEDWTDVMYIQMYGSEVYPPPYEVTDRPAVSQGRPILGALFFVSFVFLGTMIMLNLFIGVILNSMEEVQEQQQSEEQPSNDQAADSTSTSEALNAILQRLEAIESRIDQLPGGNRSG